MEKSLCKLIEKNALKDYAGAYLELVLNSRLIYFECGRVANREKILCDPKNPEK